MNCLSDEDMCIVASYTPLSAHYLFYWCISQAVLHIVTFLLQPSLTGTQCARIHQGSIPSLVLGQAMLQLRLHVLWRLSKSSSQTSFSFSLVSKIVVLNHLHV